MKWLVVVVLVAAGGCRSSRCARYADLEAKCGDAADHDLDRRRTLARGMCEAADSSDSTVATAGARFAKEADCAAEASDDDCAAYKKCRDGVK